MRGRGKRKQSTGRGRRPKWNERLGPIMEGAGDGRGDIHTGRQPREAAACQTERTTEEPEDERGSTPARRRGAGTQRASGVEAENRGRGGTKRTGDSGSTNPSRGDHPAQGISRIHETTGSERCHARARAEREAPPGAGMGDFERFLEEADLDGIESAWENGELKLADLARRAVEIYGHKVTRYVPEIDALTRKANGRAGMEILTPSGTGKDAVPEGETAADTRVWARRAGDTTTVRIRRRHESWPARWQHRESKDIDIRGNAARQQRGHQPTEADPGDGADVEPVAARGWHDAVEVAQRIQGNDPVARGAVEGETEPELEIGEFRAPLEEEVTRAMVEGHAVCVATNASILAGKWWGAAHKRASQGPVRHRRSRMERPEIAATSAPDRRPRRRHRRVPDEDDRGPRAVQEKREGKGQQLIGTTDEYEKAGAEPRMVGRMDSGALGHHRTQSGAHQGRLEDEHTVRSDAGRGRLGDPRNG